MKNQTLILSLFLILGNYDNLFSQQTNEDLLQIRQHYYEPRGQVEYLLKILYYDKKDMYTPLDSSVGKYCLAKNKMNIELDGARTISNGNYILTISEEEKVIVVSKPTLNPYANQFSFSFIDSIAKTNNVSIKKQNYSSTMSSYSFSFDDNVIDSVVIRYNRTSFKLSNLMVYYNQPINEDYNVIPVIKVQYYNEKVSENSIISNFDISKYVIIERNEVKLKPQFSEYHLINNLSF